MQPRIARLAEHVLGGGLLTRSDADYLTTVAGDDVDDLFYWANKVRIAHVGRDVKFCAIVAAKVGGCSEDCKFCAQSEHHDGPAKEQAKLTDDEVLKSAWHAAEVGADSFGIVNSGRGPTRRELEDWLKPIMMKIAVEGKTRACATLGALTPETARFLYDCGIRRINHNIETSERHYPNIVTTHPYAERINTLRVAKEAGLSLCSGGIFGMGEAWVDRLDMMFTLRELGVDVMPINFLNAIGGTPLEGQPMLPPMECLKIISIARLVLPTAELKVAGGREKVLRDLQSWIFFAGADSTMIGNYLTTYGRKPEQDHQMVMDLGLTWRSYDGGGVRPASADPQLSRVAHTGKHRIPILYEREVTAAAPFAGPLPV
ncbi:MAG TPA: biotin synthase BioB [Tepidisphaeraceae bacterium]|nr:biotin synthase BioB [Tepidisphaeraceae bacterium]